MTLTDWLVDKLGGVTPSEARCIARRLRGDARKLEALIRPQPQRSNEMAIPQDLQTALDAVDKDTDALAVVVKSLRDQITTGMTQADVDAVKAKLSDVATRLEATAADPVNPVPPGPPPSP